jgi:hypothetical protein
MYRKGETKSKITHSRPKCDAAMGVYPSSGRKASSLEPISRERRYWSARLEMCQWIRETLDKESIWDEARSTNLSRW